MLTDRLKKETQPSHIELEKITIPLIKNANTTQAYGQLLQLFYGYFKPLEDRIDSYFNSNIIPDYNERRKAFVILDDLHHIGLHEVKLTVSDNLPSVKNMSQALGALYVLEGSTLGGTIISKMIVKNLQLESFDGVKFFSGYGKETIAKWEAFKHYTNTYTASKQEEDIVISSATETFNKFKSWVELNKQPNGE